MTRERIVISRNLTPVTGCRRIEPAKHLYAGHDPVDLYHTDVASTFKRVKAEQEKPVEAPNVSPIQRRKTPSARGL